MYVVVCVAMSMDFDWRESDFHFQALSISQYFVVKVGYKDLRKKITSLGSPSESWW